MSTFRTSPAGHVARRSPERVASRPAVRPYPAVGNDARDIALAATRALARASDADTLRRIVATAVGDLGGALVPMRFEPEDALGVDISLGLGEPVAVVVEPLSVAAMSLRQVVPTLVEDARTVLQRLQPEGVLPASRTRADTAASPASGTTGDALERFLEALDRANGAAARALVTGLLRDGVSVPTIVERVLAPAQREVGQRWYRGEWTTADEHAATAITDACLAALPRSQDGPRIVVAAPDGEWHALPARMAALAARGTRASALGAGLPADAVRRHLEAGQPAALALSCTMPTNLLSAVATIASAHAAGIPVVAGGRAFGRDGHRAQRLGADAWASSASGLAALVPTLSPSRGRTDVPAEVLLADAVSDDVLALALDRHAAAATWVAHMSHAQHEQSLVDLRWLARHAAAALLCDDPRLLDELLDWLVPSLAHRAVPPHVLPDGARYLADSLEPATPQVADLLRASVGRLA